MTKYVQITKPIIGFRLSILIIKWKQRKKLHKINLLGWDWGREGKGMDLFCIISSVYVGMYVVMVKYREIACVTLRSVVQS